MTVSQERMFRKVRVGSQTIENERREESGRSFATDELVPATITRSSVEELNMELQNNIDFTCIMGTLSFFS